MNKLKDITDLNKATIIGSGNDEKMQTFLRLDGDKTLYEIITDFSYPEDCYIKIDSTPYYFNDADVPNVETDNTINFEY